MEANKRLKMQIKKDRKTLIEVKLKWIILTEKFYQNFHGSFFDIWVLQSIFIIIIIIFLNFTTYIFFFIFIVQLSHLFNKSTSERFGDTSTPLQQHLNKVGKFFSWEVFYARNHLNKYEKENYIILIFFFNSMLCSRFSFSMKVNVIYPFMLIKITKIYSNCSFVEKL